MKTWKTVAINVITTASLVTAGATAYNYLQPLHYEGDKFTNETTVMSNTDNSSDESSSSVTEQSTDSSTNNVYRDTEYSEPVQVTEDYTAFEVYDYIDKVTDLDGNLITKSGFYVTHSHEGKIISADVIEYDAETNQKQCVTMTIDQSLHPDSTSDRITSLTNTKAELFCKYMRELCPDGKTTNGLQSNFNYWMEYEGGCYYE